MKNLEFYECGECGFLKVELEDNGSDCCMEMTMLVPNTTDAATEKHMPVATFEGEYLTVKVGEVAHPMTAEHWIQAIYIVTDNGILAKKELANTDQPEYTFKIDGAKEADVYVHCNLHGVWKANFKR